MAEIGRYDSFVKVSKVESELIFWQDNIRELNGLNFAQSFPIISSSFNDLLCGDAVQQGTTFAAWLEAKKPSTLDLLAIGKYCNLQPGERANLLRRLMRVGMLRNWQAEQFVTGLITTEFPEYSA